MLRYWRLDFNVNLEGHHPTLNKGHRATKRYGWDSKSDFSDARRCSGHYYAALHLVIHK